ncbi:ABC multidrug transporter SitT [Colletotrichum graminicola]|nr:ABC multidrug transporter SitT [Colletotrichum graminicola]
MNAVYIIKEGTHADLIVRNGINANLVTLRNIHAVKEGEAPSLTSTAVESSAASISIEKHGGDSVDLAQSIKAETDDNESEKPSTSKKSKENKQQSAAEEPRDGGLPDPQPFRPR